MPISQFVVPQFIDVEDKIVGPISTRQFVVMIVGALLAFLAFKLFTTLAAIGVALLLLLLVILFGFMKVNGRPFHYFILSVIAGFNSPNFRVWHREGSPDLITPAVKGWSNEETATVMERPKFNTKLAELSLIVDTGGVYRSETAENI